MFTKSFSNLTSTKPSLFTTQASTRIKGIAIIMMLIHHCFLSPERYEGQAVSFIIPEHYVNYIALFFKICVSLFVFISTYGIVLKIKSTPSSSFFSLEHSVVIPRIIKLLANFMFVFLLVNIFCLFYEPERFSRIYGTDLLDGIVFYLLDLFGLAEFFGTPTFLATFWYYSLALLIIILTPLLYTAALKMGNFFFMSLFTIITFSISFSNTNTWHYLLCIATGIICASGNLINKIILLKISHNPRFNAFLKFIIEAVLLILLMLLREGELKSSLYPIWDSLIPVVLICFCCEFIFLLPIVPIILEFLGKHSLNIFLVHNFIRYVWFYNYTYSFQYPVLIVSILLIESLVISIIIEKLKKVLKFYHGVERLTKHFCS